MGIAKILVGTQLKFWRFKMAEEKTMTVAQMLRTTAQNTLELLNKVADHVEKIEQENAEMKRKLHDDLK